MTSTFFADTNSKIRKLKKDKTYPVQNRSGLQLIKRGNSKYFVGNMRFPFTRKMFINYANKFLRETIEKGVTVNYAWRKDDPILGDSDKIRMFLEMHSQLLRSSIFLP